MSLSFWTLLSTTVCLRSDPYPPRRHHRSLEVDFPWGCWETVPGSFPLPTEATGILDRKRLLIRLRPCLLHDLTGSLHLRALDDDVEMR